MESLLLRGQASITEDALTASLADLVEDLRDNELLTKFLSCASGRSKRTASRCLGPGDFDDVEVSLWPDWNYSMGKESSEKSSYLECLWYLPTADEPQDRAVFVALEYYSSDRTGTHLVVGIAKLDPNGSFLVREKGKDGHWVLDYALLPKDNPSKFVISQEDDGLLEHVPAKGLEPNYREGLRELPSRLPGSLTRAA